MPVARGAADSASKKSSGTEPSVVREIEVDVERLTRLLEGGRRHNEALADADGAKALDRFLLIFEPAAEKSGCEAGWKAVRDWSRKREEGGEADEF